MNEVGGKRAFRPGVWLAAAVVVLVLACWSQSARAQQRAQDAANLETIQIRPNVYMLAGAGANITVHIGPEGVILVDTGSAQMADAALMAIQQLTPKKIRYIINTGADVDHVGGNEKMSKAGLTLFPYNGGGGFGVGDAVANSGAAAILAHDNVSQRMSAPTGQQSPYPTAATPTETFTGHGKSLYLNDDGIQVIYQPAAHSDADSIVFFRRADVIAAGEVFDMTRFPVIDTENGGSIQGEIDALNRLVDLAIPAVPMVWMEARTMLVPAHGRVSDQADLVEYRDMVTIMRDRVQALVKRGMKLDQIKKENPTQGYRVRWGSDTGAWTTDKFVEAIYKSLTVKNER